MKPVILSKLSDLYSNLGKINAVISLNKPQLIAATYLLFVVTQGIVSLRAENAFNLNTFILYGLAFYCYYQKRESLKFTNNYLAQIIGLVLIVLPSLKLLTLYRVDSAGFWSVAPPVMLLGLILLADGFHGIKQFWRLLFGIVFISGLFLRIQWSLQKFVNLNVISAKVSAYFLWSIGFNAISEDTIVYVNDGAIDIYTPCTVFPMLFACIELLVIFWLFFPRAVPNLVSALIVAFSVTFPLSIVRLAIMALVVNNATDFDYWHGTGGSNVFMTASLIGFSAFILIKAPADSFSIIGNYSTINIKSNPSPWLVTSATVAASLLLITVIFLPQGGVKTFSSYQMPQDIYLSNWTLKQSTPLSPEEMGIAMANVNEEEETIQSNITAEELVHYQESQVNSNTPLAGQRYLYGHNSTQLISTLRYVVNANGLFPGIQHPDFTEFDSRILTEKLDNKFVEEDNFLLFKDNINTHLISCVTPVGKSVVNSTSLMLSDRIRHTLLNPAKVYQWLKGEKLLWDRRCLWIHLSTSTDSTNGDRQLENVWRQLLQYWRNHFPVL